MVRRVRGFTLIELMIVVAIIGILAAIAIPNFLKFQCKSKQSEAKTNLSGIFTAEKAFFGEYTSYSTDLMSVNWKPDGAPAYLYGFTQSLPTAVPVGIGTAYDATNNNSSVGIMYSNAAYLTTKMKQLLGAALVVANLPATVMSPGVSFTAGAVGDVDADGALTGVVDRWTVDQFRTLVVVDNDCSN